MSSKEIKTDPKGRYSKKELLGSGAFKTVYRAYDTEEGIEVAWNQIKLTGVALSQKKKMLQEISILGQVKHPSIMEIYDSWETDDGEYLIFITELMSSGTLKDFIRNSKKVRLRNIKKWCKQILEGLKYLHSISIIHRDLKCDNIFMNGSRGEVKIGDLGLSVSMKDKKFATSVNGTPEFMAPELYEECYNEKVDIYAFGLCVLEMVTGEYPYCECNSIAQVYRRVTSGVKPEGIEKVKDHDVKEFINLCICHKDIRPSAAELMEHPFMTDNRNNDTVFYFGHEEESNDVSDESDEELEDVRVVLGNDSTNDKYSVNTKLYIKIEGSKKYKEIKFPFNLRKDTPRDVAREMVNELSLTESFVDSISTALAECLTKAKLKFLTTKASADSTTSPSNSETSGSISSVSELSKDTNTNISASTSSTTHVDNLILIDSPSTPMKSNDTKSTPVKEMEIINLASPAPISPFNGPVITNNLTKETTSVVPIQSDTKKQQQASSPKSTEINFLSPNAFSQLAQQNPANSSGTNSIKQPTQTPVSANPQTNVKPQQPNSTSTKPLTNISQSVSKPNPQPISTNSPATPTQGEVAKHDKSNLTIETKKVADITKKKDSPTNEQRSSPLLRGQPGNTTQSNPSQQTQSNGKAIRTSPTSSKPTTNSKLPEEFEMQWEALTQKHFEEVMSLNAKHKREKLELLKKYGIAPESMKMTIGSPENGSAASIHKDSLIVNPHCMTNIGDKLIFDMQDKLAEVVKTNNEGSSVITATTIVNNLKQTSANTFKISSTSIQTTTSQPSMPSSQGKPTSITTPNSIPYPCKVPSTTTNNIASQKIGNTNNKIESKQTATFQDSDLSSLISKNLENLSITNSSNSYGPIQQQHHHLAQISSSNNSSPSAASQSPQQQSNQGSTNSTKSSENNSASNKTIISPLKQSSETPKLPSVTQGGGLKKSTTFSTNAAVLEQRMNRSFSDPSVDQGASSTTSSPTNTILSPSSTPILDIS
ncbi:hypothetical protein C9374_000481 [Naegleria lovaniensis]|uniref:Protein kinase domain-containing protein n=1 Tax=Naegleria lovaniensis TaxID=51637 RepID=A0AA88KSZ2_NAELO|nr:uncharacterized protein C9374_000481 [Naegleria lovaniensis]KAG2388317.1 hypothetical protein C9374_000481 [Naegleria lovaniensis]